MQEPDVPAALKQVTQCGAEFKMMETSFFLARQTLLHSSRPGMELLRERIFAWMLRNAASAMEFFRLPANRVVELGSQGESSPRFWADQYGVRILASTPYSQGNRSEEHTSELKSLM